MTAYVLSIDAGTGSCRAVLFDDRCRQVGVSLREWGHQEPPGVPGGQDFDVEGNWNLITECIHEVLRDAGVPSRDVVAVSATSMREGIVLFDESGRELWACPNVDSRAVAEAAELVANGLADSIYDQAGDWVSITSPARLLWLTRHCPDLIARTASIGMLSDWIAYRLSGVHATDPSCGSSSGMFDLKSRTWAEKITTSCGLPSHALPPVHEPGTVIGAVTAAAADATSLRRGTPVVTGGADTQMALVGAGIGVGQLAIIAGSFWQMAVVLDTPTIDPQARLRSLCHAIPGQWMLEGIGFYTGMSMRWFRDAFCESEVAEAHLRNVDPYVVMEERAKQIPPGSNGVVAVMSNVMNSRRWVHASPSFVQFDLNNPTGTGKAACMRAIQEAGAYVARAHRELVTDVTGDTFADLVFTGGAAKGILWPQILADVLGATVHIPAVTESSALGSAIAAGVGVGLFDSMEQAPRPSTFVRTLHPDPPASDTYNETYEAWKRIYRRMLEVSEDSVLRPMWRAAGADAAPDAIRIPTDR